MFQRKQEILNLKELASAATNYKQQGQLRFPLTNHAELNEILTNIHEGYEREIQQMNDHVGALTFLKKVLSIGSWHMKIHNNDLYHEANIMHMDEEFDQLLNFSQHRQAHNYALYTSRIHSDDVHNLDEAVAAYCKNYKQASYYECYYRLQTTSGYRWMHHFGKIECARGEMTMMNVFIMDIHEERIRELEIQYSNIRYGLIHSVLTEAPWDMVVVSIIRHTAIP